MKISNDDVVERLISLGCTDIGNETLIALAINSTEQYIKNFCNVAEVPDELYYVALDMAVGTVLKTMQSIGIDVCEGIDYDAVGIKSITEGDVSITYSTDSSTSTLTLFNAFVDRLCNRDDELVIFRKLRW